MAACCCSCLSRMQNWTISWTMSSICNHKIYAFYIIMPAKFPFTAHELNTNIVYFTFYLYIYIIFPIKYICEQETFAKNDIPKKKTEWTNKFSHCSIVFIASSNISMTTKVRTCVHIQLKRAKWTNKKKNIKNILHILLLSIELAYIIMAYEWSVSASKASTQNAMVLIADNNKIILCIFFFYYYSL